MSDTETGPLYADDPEGHLAWHDRTDDGRTVGWSCEQDDCPRSEVNASKQEVSPQ